MIHKKFFPAKKFRWHVTPLKEFRAMLLARRANEKDNMILVTGARGDGKSTFAGKVLFGYEDFDPFVSLVYSKDALFKMIKKKNQYIWPDESVINAAKGNTMTRANKLLFEISTINRDNFNIVFFCMPNVEDFDTKILQYISAWVHIDSRGLGILLLPVNKGIFGKRNWDLVGMKKIFDEFQKENQNASHVPYWIFENFRGYIKFGKLSERERTIIDEIKQLRKNENSDKEMQMETEIQAKSLDNYGKYSSKKLAEMIMKGEIRSIENFIQICNEMKVIPDEMFKKCDTIFKRNGIMQTVKQKIKEYYNQDTKISF